MPVVKTTNLFSNNEQITSAKLNNIMINSSFDSGAVVPSSGLEVTAGGQMRIPNGGITSNELASQSVTPAKLSNSDFGDFTVSGGVATIDNGVVTPVKLSQPLTSAIAQNSTSGTSIDFTGIPSWVKRITVMFSGVSTSGSSNLIVRAGTSGGIDTTNYNSAAAQINGTTASSFNITSGFFVTQCVAVSIYRGSMVLSNITSNSWVSSSIASFDSTVITYGAGAVNLGGVLDRVRITTVNGTDTFDAGSVNIMYE